MKLKSVQTIAAPAGTVFSRLTDFGAIERQVTERGAEVTRHDDRSDPAGAAWTIAFPWRGRRRRAEARVVTFDAPAQVAIAATVDGLACLSNFEIVENGESCRLHATIEATPRTLSARILLQSLRLAKGSLDRRFDARLAAFARRVETGAQA